MAGSLCREGRANHQKSVPDYQHLSIRLPGTSGMPADFMRAAALCVRRARRSHAGGLLFTTFRRKIRTFFQISVTFLKILSLYM